MQATRNARRLAVMVVLGLAAASAIPAANQASDRERTLFVSAVDERGEPVEGLGVSDFIVREDGRRREVLRVSRAVEPIDIALLVDNSASADQAVLAIREGLKGFVEAMAGEHQIAIIALADRPTLLVDYTGDRKRLDQGIGRVFSLSTSGMTLLDALVDAAAGLQRRETTRAAIIPVITDGTEFTNRYAREVIAAVKEAGASLHVVGVGTFAATDDIRRERATVIDQGARDTGGQRVLLLSERAIEQAMRKIARELSSQYKVVYGRPESFLPPESIDVASERPGIVMRGTPERRRSGARS